MEKGKEEERDEEGDKEGKRWEEGERGRWRGNEIQRRQQTAPIQGHSKDRGLPSFLKP